MHTGIGALGPAAAAPGETVERDPAGTELTDRILIFGERHLRAVLDHSTAPTTTAAGHTEHCNLSRHAPITPPRTVTTTGSDAARYWED